MKLKEIKLSNIDFEHLTNIHEIDKNTPLHKVESELFKKIAFYKDLIKNYERLSNIIEEIIIETNKNEIIGKNKS